MKEQVKVSYKDAKHTAMKRKMAHIEDTLIARLEKKEEIAAKVVDRSLPGYVTVRTGRISSIRKVG